MTEAPADGAGAVARPGLLSHSLWWALPHRAPSPPPQPKGAGQDRVDRQGVGLSERP